MIKRVAIFGCSEIGPDDPLYGEVFEVAKLLASKDYTIVNGGGPGLMKASTEGAKEGGGKTVGIYFKPDGMTHFEGRDATNLVDESIETANYVERTLKLLEYGDCYVIFKGGTGTISEFGMAWGLAKLYFGKHKPLILYGSFWHEILEAFGTNMFLREEELRVYRIVDSPEEVLEAIREFSVG